VVNGRGYIRLLVGLLILGIWGSGCSNVRRLEKGKPLHNQSAVKIENRYHATVATADWYGMRVAISTHNVDGDQNFKVNLRLRRDSALWLSITPALGVEVARIIFTEDSIRMLSKVPGNRFAYLGDYTALEQELGAPVDFKMLQSVLLGQAVQLVTEDDKYISRIDGRNYVLISKYKRRVMRLVGAKDKEILPNAELEIIETTERDERVVGRVMGRSDEEDLLVKRFWFDGLQGYLVHSVFDDLFNRQSIGIVHSEHIVEGGGLIPQKSDVVINSGDRTQEISLEITRIRTGRAYDMPFNLPKNVEIRTTF
jgi:hypothetical protein